MNPLTHEACAARLERLSGWHHRANAIEKIYDCGNFDGSMTFVNEVAKLANARDHHPDISISWNDVTLTLTTHAAHGLTDRDFDLAEAIDDLRSGN